MPPVETISGATCLTKKYMVREKTSKMHNAMTEAPSGLVSDLSEGAIQIECELVKCYQRKNAFKTGNYRRLKLDQILKIVERVIKKLVR